MPQYLITGPDGKKYKVTGPSAQGALDALKRQFDGGGASAPNMSLGVDADIGAMTPDVPVGKAVPRGNANNWSAAKEGMDTLTMGGQSKLNAAGGALVDAAFDYFRGNGWNWEDNYNKLLGDQRNDQAAYVEENPNKAAAGRAAGIALGIARGPAWGRGLKGAAVTGAGYGTVGGLLQDADTIGERITNAGKGALSGGLIGSGGYFGGKVIAKGAEKVSRAFSTINAPPLSKAEMEVYTLIQAAGGPTAVQAKLNQLGPEAALVDVLGAAGTASGRRAANISPEAREILTEFVSARKAGQNQRVVGDMERLAGLPQGSTATVDDLVKTANDAARPQINQAYTAARKAGADIPLDAFDNIITTPIGVKAFRQALDNVTSRAARDPSAGGNLAVLDETKRLLDGYATQGYRAGDPMAGEYAATAKALRERIDQILGLAVTKGGPQSPYATARALRQQAFQTENAIRTGEALGGGRVAQNIPQKAGQFSPSDKRLLAQGYVAKKSDTLLNRGNTEGAIGELYTPMGRRAAEAALGPNALDKTLARERQFNITNKEITGNSTTMRQWAEAGGYGVGAATVSALMGNDIWTTGITGFLGAVGRRSLPTIAQKLVTDNQRTVAPFLADILTKANLPLNRPIPPGFLERFVTGGDQKLAKTLNLMWLDSLQKNSPQTN